LRGITHWSGLKFTPYRLPVRVSEISGLLKAYIVVNFRACGISQGVRKLVWTPTLIIIIKKSNIQTIIYQKKIKRSDQSQIFSTSTTAPASIYEHLVTIQMPVNGK
jgi:hypothetical protein